MAELYRMWSSGEIPITGVVFAVLLAVLRGFYTKEYGWRTTSLEAAICGLLTLSFSTALDFFGIPTYLSPALGGFIGFVGVRKLRQVLCDLADARVGRKK
ncbi:phage holin, lambda family [Salmonella enterica]